MPVEAVQEYTLTKNRRELLQWCGLSFAIAAERALATTLADSTQTLGSDTVTEDQRGDPDGPDEFVTFSPAAIERLVTKSGKASFEEWDVNLPLSMIATARQFVGYSRKTNPQDVSRFLDLFDLPSTTGRGDVPFCAAGLSYCALLAYSNRLDGDRNRSTMSSRLRKLM